MMSFRLAIILCVALFVQHSYAAPKRSAPLTDAVDSEENSVHLSAVEQLPKFDLLIFTQRWAITACYEWRETSSTHICGLPSPATVWTIHGIWPTKYNSIGPAFCNKSAIFDVSQLNAIEPQLEQHWVNVEKNKPFDSLWEHEWLKHGTCAAEVIEELNTEPKYFGQGLAWLEQHSVDKAFGAEGTLIEPGQNYSLTTLNKALFDYYGKDVAIECYSDRKTHTQFLNEVRICFDKQLQPVDCDGIVGFERVSMPGSRVATVISNCNVDKPIFYPGAVPAELESTSSSGKETIEMYESVYTFSEGVNDGEAQKEYEFVEVIVV